MITEGDVEVFKQGAIFGLVEQHRLLDDPGFGHVAQHQAAFLEVGCCGSLQLHKQKPSLPIVDANFAGFPAAALK